MLLLLHFKNPILALKFDARVIVFYFSKFMMLKVHKLNFSIEMTILNQIRLIYIIFIR